MDPSTRFLCFAAAGALTLSTASISSSCRWVIPERWVGRSQRPSSRRLAASALLLSRARRRELRLMS